jgi:hypothetical protein
LGGLLMTVSPAGAMTPLIHGTSFGIGPCQIVSDTAHGQMRRGACRIFSG